MKYLYYRLWHFFEKIKTNDMPATNAMIFLTIWQFLNLSLVYILLKYYSIVEIEFELKSRKEIYLFAGVFYSILTLINYFFLYKNREKLNNKYKDESKRQKNAGNILLLLYIIGSFALILYFGSKYTASIMN